LVIGKRGVASLIALRAYRIRSIARTETQLHQVKTRANYRALA
jgi:hypothetical protein